MTRAFRLAARHSRRVRRLRVAIPATIAFILTATVLVSWLDPLKVLVRFPIDSGKIVISGTKITMEAPKLSGYTRDQRWYEMNAKAALGASMSAGGSRPTMASRTIFGLNIRTHADKNAPAGARTKPGSTAEA